MAYTPPVTWVSDGVTLDASDVKQNDDALKKYINQEIIPADIAAGAITSKDIQKVKYDPISESIYTVTSDVKGNCTNGFMKDRSYFTSTVKGSRQVDPNFNVYFPVYNCCDTTYLREDATVVITFSGAPVSEMNEINTGLFVEQTDVGSTSVGKWDSSMLLKHIDQNGNVTYIEDVLGYSYEETTVPSLGVTDPGNDSGVGARRFIGWTHTLNLTAGAHTFQVVMDPKVETGYVEARNFIVEVFYT